LTDGEKFPEKLPKMKKEKLEYKSICPICFRPCLSNEDLDDLAGEVCHRWCKQRVRSADDFQIEWTFARDNWLEQHDKIRRRILQGKIFGIAIFKEKVPDIEVYVDTTIKHVFTKLRLLWLFSKKNEDRFIENVTSRFTFEILHELSHRLNPALCGNAAMEKTLDDVLERLVNDPGVNFYD